MSNKKKSTLDRWGRILGHKNFGRSDFADIETCPVCSNIKSKNPNNLHIREILHIQRHLKKQIVVFYRRNERNE